MNLKTKNILIRICYIIPFLLFAYAFIEEGFLMEERFRQFDFWIIAPLIVFLYQSIRNSIIGWGVSMILYLIFLYLIGAGILSSIDSLGAKIDTQTFVIQLLIGLVFMGLGYLYWRIRPKKRLI